MRRACLAALAVGLLSACAEDKPEPGTIDCQEYTPGLETEATTPAKVSAQTIEQAHQRSDAERLADATGKGWQASSTKTLAGVTAAVDGRWVAPGREPGFDSGNHICATQFEGAHVCSAAEILRANEAGEFADAPAGTSIWVPRTETFYHEGQKFEADPAASCFGYGYHGADASWASHGEKPATCNGEQATKLELQLGPASPEYDKACLSDQTVCPAVIPTGYECLAKRSIACCQ